MIPSAILLGCTLIAGALLIGLGGSGDSPATTTTSNPASAPPSSGALDNSTCLAWETVTAQVSTVPALPDGWGWDTAGIDAIIAERTAALAAAMDSFEPQIAEDPANVAAAAHSFVAAKRAEIQGLQDGTFTASQAQTVNAAAAALNELCGLPG